MARQNGEFVPVSINNHAGNVVLTEGQGTGCCKLAGVNVEAWLTYFLDHVHEYDNDYSLDIADFLPSSLASKGLLKT